MAREIPEGSVEIQTGLWLYTYTKNISGIGERTFRELYSSEGYCFYNTELDTYDEDGNLNPRTYYQYMSLNNLQTLDTFHSIPIEEGSEIAGKPTKPEIA